MPGTSGATSSGPVLPKFDVSLIEDKATFRGRLLSWYDVHGRNLPWRALWREHADPYHIWLSEIMLQQTVIKAVLPAYARFLAEIPNLRTLAAASIEDVRRLSRGLGYYRRFGMLKQAAEVLVARSPASNIYWPKDFLSWKDLPGIGDYTAAAIASIAFNDPVGVVDGNVERVLCRLFDLRMPPNLPVLKKHFKSVMNAQLDSRRPGDFNQAVMELGQTTCTVTQPLCDACPVSAHCLAFARGSQALAPQAKAKVAYQDVAMVLGILVKDDELAIVDRPASAKFLKRTAGFLTAIRTNDLIAADGGAAHLFNWDQAQNIGSIKHSITSHRIKAEVLVVRTAATSDPSVRWIRLADVESELVSNLDRKALHLFLKHKRSLFGEESRIPPEGGSN